MAEFVPLSGHQRRLGSIKFESFMHELAMLPAQQNSGAVALEMPVRCSMRESVTRSHALFGLIAEKITHQEL